MKQPNTANTRDVDRVIGRILLIEPVVADGVRIVVLQHCSESFPRSPAPGR